MTAIPRYPIPTSPSPHDSLCNVRAYNVVICTLPAAADRSYPPSRASRVAPTHGYAAVLAHHVQETHAIPVFHKVPPANPTNSSHPSKLLRSSPGRCARAGGGCREVTHPVHVCPPPRLPPLRDELPESPPPRDSSMLRRDCCPVPRSLMANRKGSSSSKVLAGRVNLPPR